MGRIIEFLDLNSRIRLRHAIAKAGDGTTSNLHWIPQYLVFVAGIFIEPFLTHYQAHAQWDFSGGWGRILFAVIFGFAGFSQVYKRVVTEPVPLFVLLGPIFMAGLGWQSLVGTVAKAAT